MQTTNSHTCRIEWEDEKDGPTSAAASYEQKTLTAHCLPATGARQPRPPAGVPQAYRRAHVSACSQDARPRAAPPCRSLHFLEGVFANWCLAHGVNGRDGAAFYNPRRFGFFTVPFIPLLMRDYSPADACSQLGRDLHPPSA
ncbi:Hypothetical predicted protein [Olea europaea subsp. europaea]|uniref:Uncharacterized protein n=1 Tax=Olea europaea subsp. europaea TaxID=158383 RepID=A0A8S0RD02_OLEEU|nr:Hypothetical predicted protein [Olea europaea subsp. europaea]